MLESGPISFIHLSDIHFSKYSSSYYDVDSELRNELILDIEQNAKKNLPNIKGILVCGDIAYSGQKQEYEKALAFLKEICSKIAIPDSMVFCVPGNHDINQSICKSSRIIRCIQNDIESSQNQRDIDKSISEFMQDANSTILFSPLTEYNEFAAKFDCDISPEKPYWEQQVRINDEFALRLRGMNSVIISSDKDHAKTGIEREMIVGKYQIPTRALKTITLTLCHHPISCWKDPGSETAKLMSARSHIQLYGHKHVQTIEEHKHTLIIGSGAMQPSRSEPLWVPCYNWISIDILKEEGEEFLVIRVYPRVYKTEGSMGFFFDNAACDPNSECKSYKLVLNGSSTEAIHEIPLEFEIQVEEIKPLKMDDFVIKRTFIYDFIGLPQTTRNKILKDLNLVREGESSENHSNLMDVIIERATSAKCMDELLDKTKKYKQRMR